MPRVGFRQPGAEIELQVRELEAGACGPDPKRAVQDSPVGRLFLALLKAGLLWWSKYVPNCLWCWKPFPVSIHLPKPRV